MKKAEVAIDDDSDIEIVEEKSSGNARVSETQKDEVSSTSPSPSNSSRQVLKTMSYLTLDDIKHTGAADSDLYICPYDQCRSRNNDVAMLKSHMKECPFGARGASLTCSHCKKTMVKIGFFLEHLKTHGLKRFGCVTCGERFAVQHLAITHMKVKHKAFSKVVPADPKNPSPDGVFVVHPMVCLKRYWSGVFFYSNH